MYTCIHTFVHMYKTINSPLVYLFVDPEDDPIGLVSVIISDRFDEEELSISTPPSLRDINQENGLSLFAIPAARASVFENALRTLGYDTSLSEM